MVYVLFQESFIFIESLKYLKCAQYLTFNTMKNHHDFDLKGERERKGGKRLLNKAGISKIRSEPKVRISMDKI